MFLTLQYEKAKYRTLTIKRWDFMRDATRKATRSFRRAVQQPRQGMEQERAPDGEIGVAAELCRLFACALHQTRRQTRVYPQLMFQHVSFDAILH